MLEPMAEFAVDAGLSTADVCALLREASVRSIANRQLKTSSRVNISGIAATTGISRAEISRILKHQNARPGQKLDRPQQSTNRILAAWHSEAKFADANGQPAQLKLYGRGGTFEMLVKSHGRGIPVRAVLDELLRSRAVELMPDQRIRARTPVAIHRGLSPLVIKAFGDRAADLLSTMLSNMRDPKNPLFIATVTSSAAMTGLRPLIRKELSTKSAEFLSEVQQVLALGHGKRRDGSVGVTVFCHEALRRGSRKGSFRSRINFRRRPE